ncbi:MAG: hypothetical protein RMM31_05270 [Anaerolineae bacterium]|nr:hypothetical protein [Thermoflexales bacterium]MDW8395638.1 hypothetical protein [Anaerolineae bacterium]
MIDATVFFIFFIVMFGFFGTVRGWAREVIALFSMMFGLFIYTLPEFNRILQPLLEQQDAATRFVWRILPFAFIAFMGYLGPAILSRSANGDRGGGRFESGLLAFIVGGFNGYLLLSALAYWALDTGLLAQNTNLFRPPEGGWEKFFFIQSASPVIFSGTTLIIVVVVVFLFVITVLV